MASSAPVNKNGDVGEPGRLRALRLPLMAFGAAVVLVLGSFGLADALGRDDHAGTPAGTVRDFLITAVVDDDGVDACRYLTPNAERQVDAVEPANTTCSAAVSSARLVLGGERIDTEAAVKGLTYRVQQHGGRASVTVSAHGAARTFELRTATAAERSEFEPPPTPWRIDSGVESLVPAAIG